MVPSLPLWLKVPLTPMLLLALAAWLLSRVESSMLAIKPVPNVGVGMRKMMLLAAFAALKLGWPRLQAPASARPLTVNRSSTPPFGALVLAVPLALKKNGNRTSRTGPLARTKYGMVLVFPLTTAFVITWLCGLAPTLGKIAAAGLLPPAAGWE